MELKPGYKQTEVGVIPEEWHVVSIGDVATVGRGRVISQKDIAKARNPQYPIYSSQTSNEGVMGYLDSFDFDGEYVTWTTDGANAGTVFARNGRFNCTNVCGTIKLRSDNHTFVAHVLGQFAPRHVSRHLGNPKLMNDIMKRVKIPLPVRRKEQDVVAEALSDVDALLGALDRLIAKKRDLKQAAMQQLLTGQTRLPGFHGEWEVKPLSQHFKIYAGGDVPKHSLSQTQSDANPYPIFANAIQNKGLYGYTNEHRSTANSLTITARGYLGHAEYRDQPFFPIVRLLVLEPCGQLDARFTTYVVNDRVEFAIESTGVPQLTTPQVGKYSVAAPPTLAEQTAIAAVLSDMDAEIEALEARRAKTRDLKQAMMQELLTGRTRLVQSEATHA